MTLQLLLKSLPGDPGEGRSEGPKKVTVMLDEAPLRSQFAGPSKRTFDATYTRATQTHPTVPTQVFPIESRGRWATKFRRIYAIEAPCDGRFFQRLDQRAHQSGGSYDQLRCCAASTARATRKAVDSWKCAASTCMPTGKPAEVAPHGTVTPQMPARLAVTV